MHTPIKVWKWIRKIKSYYFYENNDLADLLKRLWGNPLGLQTTQFKDCWCAHRYTNTYTNTHSLSKNLPCFFCLVLFIYFTGFLFRFLLALLESPFFTLEIFFKHLITADWQSTSKNEILIRYCFGGNNLQLVSFSQGRGYQPY